MININYMREIGFTAEELLAVGEALAAKLGWFLGDQAVLSAAFPDEIKYFSCGGEYEASYRPYNFDPTSISDCAIDVYDGKLRVTTPSGHAYVPAVYHYSGLYKPWRFRFTAEDYAQMRKKLPPLAAALAHIYKATCLYKEFSWFFDIYWLYCAMTPIYDEIANEARISNAIWKSAYLPAWLWGRLNQERLERAQGLPAPPPK